MKYILIFTLIIWTSLSLKLTSQTIGKENENSFIFSTWVNGGNKFDSLTWTNKLREYQDLGIDEILVKASPEYLSSLIPFAQNYNIKVHAWMWTLNRPGDKVAMQHPEWYSVNKKGDNSLEFNAYVGYYQWLSPFHPDARDHIKDIVKSYFSVEGLASVHLDYVRYVDVILGAMLQPKYGIVQDKELPEYDFGYHPIAREGFKKIFGRDPVEMDHPELSTEWRQYRLNAVTSLVNEIVEMAHQNGHKITAAVFPFPEMSRQMVRQAWNDWKLDAAYPMLYNNFYNEGIEWIGFCAKQAASDVDFPVHAGLFASALTLPQDLERAIYLAKETGSSGITIFMVDGMTEEQKYYLKKLKEIKTK